MRWNEMYRWWCEGGGDRAWWVIESVFLRSPDKGFWACLVDLPPVKPRRPETWVSLCNLMLKLRGISCMKVCDNSTSKRIAFANCKAFKFNPKMRWSHERINTLIVDVQFSCTHYTVNTSPTLNQHWAFLGSMSRVYWIVEKSWQSSSSVLLNN